ncbi:Longitudinals lacking protein, isoforms A/B/D/L [Camponotus floridanus]|uniref:Longitudinals lacking protein, isoforms A/B/D/L n=2 Tax=Camponotus floridanus TaxID=104421 RepID=E2AEV9_CAMFO|nr:Longitudinals lacking protein, isoforms A/B/D/L [Camponotus floridanus]
MLPLPWPDGTYSGGRSPRRTRTRFPCPRCRKSYTTKSAVTAHFKYDCGKPPRFECPYCGKLSKKKFNIQDHIRHKHPSKQVICNTLF